MSPKIFVIGAGGHAVGVIDILEQCKSLPIELFDDDPNLHGSYLYGYPVLGGRDTLFARYASGVIVVVGIARNDIRQEIVRELEKRNISLSGFRHLTSVLSPRAKTAPSAQVMAGVIVNAGACIEQHAILNTACLIEHDSIIGPFSHVGPGAMLAGAVRVSEGAFLGTGACILPSRTVGAWATVGAGAVVTSDVPAHATVVGIPARRINSRK